MTNYIKTFSDETAYEQFRDSSEFVTPNVSYCSGGSNSLFFNPKPDYSKDYLTFIPKADGTFSINDNGSGTTSNTISYSIEGGEWINIGYGVQTPTVQAGQKIRFKGTPDASYTEEWKSIGTFQCTTSFDAEGNAMSMTHGDNFQSATAMESHQELAALFMESSIISSENLVLPATELTDYCYATMFAACTSLTTAPALPAMTLAQACYYRMFEGCTSLTTSPALPAGTLTVYCYYYMFNGCRSLSSITCLATDISAEDCTDRWVSGVASSGTFTKVASMTGWDTGVSGIPSGWDVDYKQ